MSFQEQIFQNVCKNNEANCLSYEKLVKLYLRTIITDMAILHARECLYHRLLALYLISGVPSFFNGPCAWNRDCGGWCDCLFAA